jgi:hypothetical protein
MKFKLALALATALGLIALSEARIVSAFTQAQSDLLRENPNPSSSVSRRAISPSAESSSADQDPFAPLRAGRSDDSEWSERPYTLWVKNDEAKLAQSAAKLARTLGEAKSDAERDKLKDQLNKVVESQFDLRQKRHANEIAELEARVKKLKDLLAKRQENRREIVSKRLEQILSEAQGLGW